ncbi:MAG: hypothetical protein KF878_11325 [Planctomycetes bacterium]|nr:hypothetical protein [Planctomycetota bacterium]
MNRVRALATASLVTAFGLAQADAAFAQAREAVEYTTITRRVTGGPPFPVRAVLTSAEEYARFFRTREPAQCDFTSEFLILVHLGTEGSQGYTVRVTAVERVQSNPPVVTVKYRLTPGGAGAGTVGGAPVVRPTDPPVVAEAPAELIKVRRLQERDRSTSGGIDLSKDQLRFFEEGGMDRVGFNVISRTLTGSAFEQVTVDFTGDVKVRRGPGEPKKTRLLLSELDRMAVVVQNSQIKSLPRTLPTQQLGGTRFFFNHFDGARRRTIVEGTQQFEGAYADRIRPMSQAFDLILGRLERRPIQVEGVVEVVEEADAVRIQGALGLSYYLRGPLARKLVVLQGRKVVLEAVAQLKSSTEAEGVIRRVLYPQRSQIAGTIGQQGGKLVIVPAYPMPDAPIPLLGPRAQELVGPEMGKPVMLDMWLMFNDRGLPSEGFVESILAITLSHVVLRDRPEAQSMPVGELPERTTVWVSARRGGAEGVALASANMKSGWVPSQLLRFHYEPKIPGLTEGITPRNPNESGDPRLRDRIERELEDERNRSRNPNVDRPR